MFAPHRKHIYGRPRPVTGTDLLFFTCYLRLFGIPDSGQDRKRGNPKCNTQWAKPSTIFDRGSYYRSIKEFIFRNKTSDTVIRCPLQSVTNPPPVAINSGGGGGRKETVEHSSECTSCNQITFPFVPTLKSANYRTLNIPLRRRSERQHICK
jgi:hypothetical protein